MSDFSRLSHDAQSLLVAICKNYTAAVRRGTPRSEASLLGGCEEIQKAYAPKLSPDDVNELIRELDRAGFLNPIYSDDRASDCELTCQGISAMEHRFSDALKEGVTLLGSLSDFKNIIK